VAHDLALQEVIAAAPIQSEPGVIAVLSDIVQVPPEFQAQVRSFVSNVAVVDSITTAIRLRSAHAQWTFVTREGDALSQDGILTGGTAESVQSGVIQRRREIKDLTVRRDEASGKLALAQATLTKLEQALKTLIQELESARKKNNEQEMRVMSLRKDLERAENEERNARQAVERSDLEVNRLQMQVQRTDQDIEAIQSRLEEIRAEKARMDGEVQVADETLKSDRAGIDGLQREVTDLQVRLAQKSQELQGLQSQLETLKKSADEVAEQLARMSSEKEKSGEVLSTHQVLVESKKIELEKRIAEVNECKQRVALARDGYEKLNSDVRQYESAASAQMSNLNEIRQGKTESQIRLEQLRTKEQVLSNQIYERYMLQLSETAEAYREREADVEALDIEVQELKAKLAKIGDVNLSSIKEYDDLIQRYEFLNQQYKDLVESKEQLRRVIDRINRVCSKRFKETFVLVNERFSKVFPVLFGGGEAQLTLIEDPEKDEMGIDIVARPPGKKLQNVSLLSGGEKALTAVSLIFSIFLVKPSPFCLLDEVDAPLDDANVARFNDLVKEMAKRSQIIVVTHNKHTMKVNNILYGVTMEEKGVSKMVSVNLVEAEQVIALGS
jgi:chromosome segregation protein